MYHIFFIHLSVYGHLGCFHVFSSVQSVQSLSRVRLFATPWIAARQASLSITNSQSSFRLMSIESVMPSSHFILYRPLLLLTPIPPSIRVFSNESTLLMRWPKYWTLASFLPKNTQDWTPIEWTGWISLQSKGLSRVFSNTTDQPISSVQFSSVTQSCPTLWDPMNRSTPGPPVHHHLPEFTQTHVHRVCDAIQPFHPLLSPASPAPNPSQHQSLFQWVNTSHEVAKVLEFQL